MNRDNGFITLHRKITEWEWYQDQNTFRLFIHLLLTANHADKPWKGIVVHRGQTATGVYSLSKQTNLSVQQIRTSLKKLQSTKEITVKSTNQFSIYTIENYNYYQDKPDSSNKRITNHQQTDNKRITTNNNENNENNITKEIYVSSDKIMIIFNKLKLPNVLKISEQRKKRIKQLHGYLKTEKEWIGFFEKINKSDFLMGRSSDWSCTFDWVINQTNALKIMEGNYDNKGSDSPKRLRK